jgi:hypothetical protein
MQEAAHACDGAGIVEARWGEHRRGTFIAVLHRRSRAEAQSGSDRPSCRLPTRQHTCVRLAIP